MPDEPGRALAVEYLVIWIKKFYCNDTIVSASFDDLHHDFSVYNESGTLQMDEVTNHQYFNFSKASLAAWRTDSTLSVRAILIGSIALWSFISPTALIIASRKMIWISWQLGG